MVKFTPPTNDQMIIFGQNPYNGVIIAKTPIPVYNEIDKLTQNIINSNFNAVEYNKGLAGHINREYELIPTSIVIDYVKDLVKFHSEHFVYYKTFLEKFINPPKLTLDKLWVNYQLKHEYNPAHIHSGLFSFVFWHKIPYYSKDEENYGPGKYKHDEENLNGKFSFFVPENQIKSFIGENIIPVDKNWEGTVAIFPASMHHCVYPFYSSDEYRITVAGNVYFE